ncbi:MAG: 4-phosphopantoate--beta-alanine ligase [Candidatus Methanolliviera sp. GoM_asphalt]|nr:MAG: 4-phosphopantoate--beta-alanine ligase [Candidatus Methanolliviera sp. GoM_asphalt]
MTKIPKSHPRYSSLITREKLIEAYEEGILDEGALIEFGREEAVDYLIGERTIEEAYRSTKVAVSYILLSKNPMIVLDGVCLALSANKIKKICRSLGLSVYLGEDLSEVRERLIGRLKAEGIEPKERMDTDLLIFHGKNKILKYFNGRKIYFGLNIFSNDLKGVDVIIIDSIIRFFSNIEEIFDKLREKRIRELIEITKDYKKEEIFMETLNFVIKRIEKTSDDDMR